MTGPLSLQSVSIPGATRLVLKFDAKSNTTPGACLAVCSDFSDASVLSRYSGSFGGTTLSSMGDRVVLKFPVEGESTTLFKTGDMGKRIK